MNEDNLIYESLYLEIKSNNYEESILFYENLNFHVTHDVQMADGSRKLYMRHAYLNSISIEFLGGISEKEELNNSMRFNVKAIDDLLRRFKYLPKDRISVSETPYAKMATLVDPFGFKIHVVEFFVDE